MAFPQQNLITADYPGGKKKQSFDPFEDFAMELFIEARFFGIVPDYTVDCAPGFARLANWIMTSSFGFTPTYKQPVIVFEPGDYYISEAIVDLTYKGVGALTPRFTLQGSGAGVTRFKALPGTSAPVLITFLVGFAANVTLKDLDFSASSAFVQHAVHFVATRRSLDNTGGVTRLVLDRADIYSTGGDALTFVGGTDTSAPNQFISIRDCTISATIGTSLKAYGQFGQVICSNADFSSFDKNLSANALVNFSADNRQTIAPSAVDTVLNNFTMSNQDLPSGTPVWFIGTNLPSGLTAGVTYYIRKTALTGTAAPYGLSNYTVHTTPANLVSDTRVALGSTGTIGNWFVTPLYLTAVEQNTLVFQLPHNLALGAPIQLIGTNLPSGLVAATTYYVIRKSHLRISLATSAVNAYAGTEITFSGGNTLFFGLHKPTNTTNTYSVDFQATSIQNGLIGLYLAYCDDIRAHLHVENMRCTIYSFQSRLSIVGGNYGNPADDGGKGVVLALRGATGRTTIDGGPYLHGTVDQVMYTDFSPVYPLNSFTSQSASINNSKAVGLPVNLGAAASVDIEGYDKVFINASATVITTLLSKHGPGKQIKVMAWGGTITFGTGGNLKLPGNANVVLPDAAVAIFELWDTVGNWVMVGKSG